MTRYLGQSGFRHDQPLRTGVLLTNLGTPQAPTRGALRRYLKEFLSDPRVVEFPRAAWWLILNLAILNIRPARSAEAYRSIWTEQGSPLLVNTRALARGLSDRLDARLAPLLKIAMRYGEPSISSALREMHEVGLHRLLVLPMYPQYSASTTGSTFDAVSRELSRWRWVPELRFVAGYHDHDLYIEALAKRVRQTWEQGHRGELLLMSFHGIPRRYLLQGDPYHCQCQATARLLAERLALREDQWMVVFQSRFGREPWLQPYCDETLKALPSRGIRSVDVVCPGFSMDCLETLEEIAIRNRELFRESGGEILQYIPCLNDEPAHRELMLKLVEQHTRGWPELEGPIDSESLRLRRERALAMGAEQ